MVPFPLLISLNSRMSLDTGRSRTSALLPALPCPAAFGVLRAALSLAGQTDGWTSRCQAWAQGRTGGAVPGKALCSLLCKTIVVGVC